MFRKLFATTDDYVLLLLRFTLGLAMFPHGAQKMLGWFGGPGFTGELHAMQTLLHIPPVLMVLAILAEFFGALGLIAGLLSRPAAFGMIVVMLVAVFTVHLPNGFFMNWFGTQKGEGFEYHLLIIGLALPVLLRGSGLWSLDGLIARRLDAASTHTAFHLGQAA